MCEDDVGKLNKELVYFFYIDALWTIVNKLDTKRRKELRVK